MNPLRDVDGHAPVRAPCHVSDLETERLFTVDHLCFPYEALLSASPVIWRIHPQQPAR